MDVKNACPLWGILLVISVNVFRLMTFDDVLRLHDPTPVYTK